MKKDIILSMLLWFHIEANHKLKRMNVGKVAECLKTKHSIKYVREAKMLASAITDPSHQDSVECECSDYLSIEEESGCSHPNLCTKRVMSMLNTLLEKWDPRKSGKEEQPDAEGETDQIENALKIFNTNKKIKGYISNTFRIFTSRAKCNKLYIKTPTEHFNAQLRATIWRKKQSVLSEEASLNEGMVNLALAGVCINGNEGLNDGIIWFNIGQNTHNSAALVAMILASL